MKINKLFKKIQQKSFSVKGFTLIETLVAVTLFTFVTFIAVVALFSLQQFNNKLKVTKSVYENVYLSMDIVTSDLKQGTNFENLFYSEANSAGGICQNAPGTNDNESCLSFDYLNLNTSNSSNRTGYYLDSGKIKKYSDSSVPSSITSDDIEITKLKFLLVGAGNYSSGDAQQPMIKIIVKGKSKILPVTSFSVENIISQRSVGN
jgi:type II secretory pathway pseudopilin PulG